MKRKSQGKRKSMERNKLRSLLNAAGMASCGMALIVIIVTMVAKTEGMSADVQIGGLVLACMLFIIANILLMMVGTIKIW